MKINKINQRAYVESITTAEPGGRNKLLIEQLVALTTATWDGDLISKTARSELVRRGLAARGGNGFTVITPAGLDFLSGIKIISP